MPRNRRPTPADQARIRQAAALELVAQALQPTSPAAPVLEQPDTTTSVRHLTIEHLGRWVSLAPREGGDVALIKTTAGRLVGILPGGAKSGSTAPTRKLIIQTGSITGPIEYSLDHPATVAPRSWS